MPLINTSVEIESILEESGLRPKKSETLESKLKENRLDTDSILSEMSGIVHNTESDIVRLRAIEMAARLNIEMRQAMNDVQSKQIPTVNIIIQDANAVSVNPILIPRELSR